MEVNIEQQSIATVEVTDAQNVVVLEPTIDVVKVVTPGPQGPVSSANVGLDDITDVNTTSKVDKSVLYYDADAGEWKGDDINTVITLTDGGAF